MLENGKILKKQFTVEGRKQLLIDIRKHTLKLHEKYMRLRNDSFYDDLTLQSASQLLKDLNEFKEGDSLDEMKMRLKKMERTRHITMWHDASTLANHGHVVFTVNMLYDKASFYTNEEYKANTVRNINVQTEIEKPIVYIVARCRANDEQLAYVQTRIDCTNRLSVKLDTESRIQFTDKLRFFKGDSPAVQLEVGNQKGGYFFCQTCGIHALSVLDFEQAFRCHIRTYEEHPTIVTSGYMVVETH